MNSQVLTLILKDGDPTGIIECSVDEWFGIAYKIPRLLLNTAKNLEYINNTGIYILVGDDEDSGDKVIYIGEAENIYKRLEQHNKNKDYWSECLVFVSENNSLNKAHIKYIEHELYNEAIKSQRYIIKNTDNPTKSSLGSADEIKAIKFAERIKMLSTIFGYNIFNEKVKDNEISDENLLYLTINKVTYATGIMTNEGFVVLKGSKIRDDISPKISESTKKFIKKEKMSKDIENNTFINNHLCSTPSMAAVLILGRNSNGYNEWKDKNGKKLGDILGRN